MRETSPLQFWRQVLAAVLAFALAGCAVIPAQQTKRATPTPTPAASQPGPAPSEGQGVDRPVSEPYTGDLSIFENPEREQKLQIDRVMDLLGIKEGSGVADIGAGSGWFTVRAARRVGGTGTVYAVEINPDFIKHIERRAADEKLANIKTVLGREDDPTLPEKSVDAVLILKTYHEVAQPVRLLTHLRRSLREGALVGVIDRSGKGDDHGVARDTVVREAEQAGFVLVGEHDFVKPDGMDYFLVFRAKRSDE